MNLERYRAFAQKVLTPQRFQHSVDVTQVMEDLTPIYGLDPEIAQTIGLLHDVGKELDAKTQLTLAQEAGLVFVDECENDPVYLHGPIGAYRIANELGVTDPIVLDTIARHAFFGAGSAVAPAYFWCLRFGDMLEPQRDWTEVRQQLAPLIYGGQMLEAAYHQVQWNIHFFHARHMPVHPQMQRAYEALRRARQQPHQQLTPHETPC